MSNAVMHQTSINDFFPKSKDPFSEEDGMDGYSLHNLRAAVSTLKRMKEENPDWEKISARLDEYPVGCLKAMLIDLFEWHYTVARYRDRDAVEYIMGGNK